MFNYVCPHAERRQKGIMKYLWCKKIDNICANQRFCPTKRDVEHTTLAPRCTLNTNTVEEQNKVIEGE